MNWLKRLLGAESAASDAPPQGIDARYEAACALMEREDFEQALQELRKLRDEAPELPQVHYSLGYALRQLGWNAEAIAAYRRALELRPNHADTRSNLLLTLNYSADHTAAEICEEHRRYGERHVQPRVSPAPDRVTPRRLRIGYLSPDFYSHVVSCFMLPALARQDREKFETFCYHSGSSRDAVTERMRALAGHWVDCAGQTDAQIAARIRADRIDILVDLAGHMAQQRLGVLALRPAPVQATYLGYPNTTGLSAVDWRITDARADPPGESDRLHVERLARLPRSFLCYRPGPETRAAAPLPAARAGYVTFGCFNNFQKLSGSFFDAAAQLLSAVPGSRLLLKAKPLRFASVQGRVAERFARAGIDASRLTLRAWEASVDDHLAAYDGVDIALDSFPYNGTTTTCEALWMGVPVVTLRGDRHASRVGASLLRSVGLDELIAEDAADYVRRAGALAVDRARLAGLRAGLRERLKGSPLMDEEGFVRELEAAYASMWQARLLQPEPQPENREALELFWKQCSDGSQHAAAIERLGAALAAAPGDARLHYMLGCSLQDLERREEAIDAYREALRLEPGLAKAANNLGALLELSGQNDEAMRHYEMAALADPQLAQALVNVAGLHKRVGNPAAAVPWLRKAIALEPHDAGHLSSLAESLVIAWKLDEAVEACRSALALDPGHLQAHFALGNALQVLGRADEAEPCFREAMRINPALSEVHSNLLLALHYRKGDERAALFEEHLEWGRRHGTIARLPAAPAPAEGAPLRIGYLSPNFHRHSVAFFLEALLAAHDRAAFRIHGYSNVASPDKITARLKSLCDGWRDISELSDEEAAQRIRADGIDILVDLAGHTGGGRMGVFARKPAPVQVSWLGYPNTTGLTAMDWRLSDARADPPGDSDRHSSERIYRLEKGFHCYAPPENAPPVGEAPGARAGYVTFGSFNNLAKITPDMVALWASILAAAPRSRLLLKAYGIANESAQRSLAEGFAAHGVEAARITLLGADPALTHHLARYSEVDIALDTFPYHGTTTTCEALWMGVPVVTLQGQAHVSRVGVSLLHQVGLQDLVARDRDDYRAKAVALAADPRRIGELRAGLRERLRASPLMDRAGFARAVEAAYRKIWDMRAKEPKETEEGLRLHIGGKERREGWKVLNIQAGPAVDYVGDCTDLSRFADGSVAVIYASHVLEHLAYRDRLPKALAEIHRVLRPGGRLLASVPDFEVVCRLFLAHAGDVTTQFSLMRMAFGGEMDAHDFHHVGLSLDIFARYLKGAGFADIERVERFGLFDDTSDLRVGDTLISLNVIASK